MRIINKQCKTEKVITIKGEFDLKFPTGYLVLACITYLEQNRVLTISMHVNHIETDRTCFGLFYDSSHLENGIEVVKHEQFFPMDVSSIDELKRNIKNIDEIFKTKTIIYTFDYLKNLFKVGYSLSEYLSFDSSEAIVVDESSLYETLSMSESVLYDYKTDSLDYKTSKVEKTYALKITIADVPVTLSIVLTKINGEVESISIFYSKLSKYIITKSFKDDYDVLKKELVNYFKLSKEETSPLTKEVIRIIKTTDKEDEELNSFNHTLINSYIENSDNSLFVLFVPKNILTMSSKDVENEREETQTENIEDNEEIESYENVDFSE